MFRLQRNICCALLIVFLGWGMALAQVPPNISRGDGGNYIDKLVTLLAYLRTNAQLVIQLDTSKVVVSNASAELPLYSVTIPANTLSTTTGIHINLHGYITNQTGAPVDYTL